MESPSLSPKNVEKRGQLKYKNLLWWYTCLCVCVCTLALAAVKFGIPLMSEVIKQSKLVGDSRSKNREWAKEPFTSRSMVSV